MKVTNSLLEDAHNGRIGEPSFSEKTENLLAWYAFLSKTDKKSRYGAVVRFDPNKDYPAAYCHDPSDGNAVEWEFVFKPLFDLGLVESKANGLLRITGKGWEHYESRAKAVGVQGFVAMSFRPEMVEVDKAICEAVTAAGYAPKRIDRSEYVGGVMDEIVSEIRQSLFVIADFTHNRGGVYFEAGFAQGLGKKVISMCREDHIDKADPQLQVHFDVQHLNLLVWRASELGNLTTRLKNRLTAIFGQGPL